MYKADISALIAYNFWADDRILTACEQVSVDEFTREITPNPGWGSLRGILVHALDTEYGWRLILQAQDASEIMDEADFADVATLRTRWDVERMAWLTYESGLNEVTLNKGYGEDPKASLKVWQKIVHVVNHGTQHRSEAAAVLTGFGQSPGELDFDTFLAEHPEYIPG
ncbi:MAG: DinB family protein [Chloroflexota bacterium]